MALAAIPLILSLAAASCLSFSLVNYRSTLNSLVKVLCFSLTRLVSFMVTISSFFNFEFSASKVVTWDHADSILASEARYSEVRWRLSPNN